MSRRVRQSRYDLLANRGKRREQRLTLREEMAVQLTARSLERRFEARQFGLHLGGFAARS